MTNQPPPVPESVWQSAREKQLAGELPVIAIDLPILYEDEGQENMGDTLPHSVSIEILGLGLGSHLAPRPEYHVIQNMNLYYHPIDRWSYVSPDLMVLKPPRPLWEGLRSYRIGDEAPAPVLAIEVLSRRSFQQQDLTNKPVIYASLGVSEYLLVDVTGEFMPQRLMMKRLQDDRTWIDEIDNGQGVMSVLGFRVLFEDDGQLRVADTATGRRYLRPLEVRPVADALVQALARLRDLEEENARLRSGQQQKE